MDYTIKEMAHLAGITQRTLRYYDEIGLLKPRRDHQSGYRVYEQKEVDLLQQILIYRSMDMKLSEIQDIMEKPDFDVSIALKTHHQALIVKRDQLQQLILTVEKSMAYHKGESTMSNKEKFEGLKNKKLAENEQKYGKEIREKYGKDIVEASNHKYMNLTEDEYKRMQQVEEELFVFLKEVVKTKDLDSLAAKQVYEKHKAWLKFTWPSYTPEAHLGLAKMYLADERFGEYYNQRAGSDVIQVLHDIILKHVK